LSVEHFDVVIVGAGLSGIGAGCHLQERSPGKTYAILEAREAIGGTWDLFRYPGVRSDSDMYTLGYSFRPWEHAKSIADGDSILSYVRDTAVDHGVERHIRFGHRVVRAEWSTADARWTVEVVRADTQETVRVTCGFLFMCTGYYRYDEGHTPQFSGIEDFQGEIVHPQHWGDDVVHAGKRVVVIGSGATAVTLVPALAERAAHVTMLQRSPSYVISLPAEDPFAKLARRLLPAKAAYALVRWKNVLVTMLVFQLSRRRPSFIKRLVQRGLERRLPAGYDIDKHFTPSYDPWDQRMCLVPDSDLFEAISAGRASVVTDHIDSFTTRGVKLRSGAELQADLIVTATGLNLLMLGGTEIVVDGHEVVPAETTSYRGMMLSGVPNLAMSFGYTNASWTLKADLTCAYVCRLLNHMDEHGYRHCTPMLDGSAVNEEPFIDFSSGYVQRSIHLFPKQGKQVPWRVHQNYALDLLSLRYSDLDDGAMRFSRGAQQVEVVEPLAAAGA
jgi:monooxygenase